MTLIDQLVMKGEGIFFFKRNLAAILLKVDQLQTIDYSQYFENGYDRSILKTFFGHFD